MSSKLSRKEHICKREKLLETYRLILDDIEQTFLHIFIFRFEKKRFLLIWNLFLLFFRFIHQYPSNKTPTLNEPTKLWY